MRKGVVRMPNFINAYLSDIIQHMESCRYPGVIIRWAIISRGAEQRWRWSHFCDKNAHLFTGGRAEICWACQIARNRGTGPAAAGLPGSVRWHRPCEQRPARADQRSRPGPPPPPNRQLIDSTDPTRAMEGDPGRFLSAWGRNNGNSYFTFISLELTSNRFDGWFQNSTPSSPFTLKNVDLDPLLGVWWEGNRTRPPTVGRCLNTSRQCTGGGAQSATPAAGTIIVSQTTAGRNGIPTGAADFPSVHRRPPQRLRSAAGRPARPTMVPETADISQIGIINCVMLWRLSPLLN